MVTNTSLLSRVAGRRVPGLLLTLLPLAALALAPPAFGQGLPGLPGLAETEEAFQHADSLSVVGQNPWATRVPN